MIKDLIELFNTSPIISIILIIVIGEMVCVAFKSIGGAYRNKKEEKEDE